MYEMIRSRRDFIQNALISTLAFPILTSCRAIAQIEGGDRNILEMLRRNAQPRGAEGMGAIDVPANVSWTTTLSNQRDKGEPMEIGGTVFQSDGKTIAPNTLIYLYHTDFEGYYGRSSNEHKHGRYRGWMLTDKHGRYLLRTIKAAPYPENRFAAHIHMSVTGLEQREDWIDSILFEGDRLISARERQMAGRRGGFQPIVTLTKGKDGVLRGTRDIQLLTA